MFSLSKIFWLVLILGTIWFIFKFIERKKNDSTKLNKSKRIDAFKCKKCGFWSADEYCKNKHCPLNNN